MEEWVVENQSLIWDIVVVQSWCKKLDAELLKRRQK